MPFVHSGSCPKCGSPIWSPTTWKSPTEPPPSYPTCDCSKQQQIIEEFKKIVDIVEKLSEKVSKLEKETEQKKKPNILKD